MHRISSLQIYFSICYNEAAVDSRKVAIQSNAQVTLIHASLFYCYTVTELFISSYCSSPLENIASFVYFYCLLPHTLAL